MYGKLLGGDIKRGILNPLNRILAQDKSRTYTSKGRG